MMLLPGRKCIPERANVDDINDEHDDEEEVDIIEVVAVRSFDARLRRAAMKKPPEAIEALIYISEVSNDV